jgi:hypothetical protein
VGLPKARRNGSEVWILGGGTDYCKFSDIFDIQYRNRIIHPVNKRDGINPEIEVPTISAMAPKCAYSKSILKITH